MLILSVAASAAVPAAQAQTYTLDPGKSTLYVVVRNDPDTLASRLGHDHVISAEAFSGQVTWNPDDAGDCAVDIAFPITALRVDPSTLRDEAGLDPDGAVGDGAKRTITSNFSKKSQLWASAFPEIRYTATSCDGTKGTVNVAGALSIRGIDKALTVPMQIDIADGTFRARGRFEATHADFGFKPFTNLAGALRNLNRLEFVIDVRGTAGS